MESTQKHLDPLLRLQPRLTNELTNYLRSHENGQTDHIQTRFEGVSPERLLCLICKHFFLSPRRSHLDELERGGHLVAKNFTLTTTSHSKVLLSPNSG